MQQGVLETLSLENVIEAFPEDELTIKEFNGQKYCAFPDNKIPLYAKKIYEVLCENHEPDVIIGIALGGWGYAMHLGRCFRGENKMVDVYSMTLASYHDKEQGVVTLGQYVQPQRLENKVVVIAEDVIDTAKSLKHAIPTIQGNKEFLKHWLEQSSEPNHERSITHLLTHLLDKPSPPREVIITTMHSKKTPQEIVRIPELRGVRGVIYGGYVPPNVWIIYESEVREFLNVENPEERETRQEILKTLFPDNELVKNASL